MKKNKEINRRTSLSAPAMDTRCTVSDAQLLPTCSENNTKKEKINNFRYLYFALFLILIVFSTCKNDFSVSTSLPRSVPEKEGVSSEGILTFLDSAATKHEFHSFMFLRHGKVIAEGWWNPYQPCLKHTMYSVSKSWTSSAVGFAVSEKLFTVDDKVISFFPDELPDSISPFLAEMKVKDLLTMSSGQYPDPTYAIASGNGNWTKDFLAYPVVNEPGSKFLYTGMNTFMLCAIIKKVSGENVYDYLKPRLFDPLDIQGIDWEVNPQGINHGGSGLRLKTEDMAKLGQLYLQKGKWNGKQLIPSMWIEEATTFKIDQAPEATQSEKDISDWKQGYCYQFWRCRNSSFRADGASGQFIIVMPEKDAVIPITAEVHFDMQEEINMVWDYLLPAIKDEPLPENTLLSEKLKQRLSSLALPLAEKSSDAPVATAISGKVFVPETNPGKFESFSFKFSGEECKFLLKADNNDYSFTFGAGTWITDETSMPGPSLSLLGVPPWKIAGSYSWKDDNTLELVLRYIESPHTRTFTCKFDKDSVQINIHNSLKQNRDSFITGKLVTGEGGSDLSIAL